MNVLAALELGEQLASLGSMETGDLPPGRLDRWRAEALLGELCSCLWSVFVQLALEQQLVKLSKLAHMTAYLFEGTGARTKFLTDQLYHDIQAMVKNAYFCAAKERSSRGGWDTASGPLRCCGFVHPSLTVKGASLQPDMQCCTKGNGCKFIYGPCAKVNTRSCTKTPMPCTSPGCRELNGSMPWLHTGKRYTPTTQHPYCPAGARCDDLAALVLCLPAHQFFRLTAKAMR
jgi:hypothetical protein